MHGAEDAPLAMFTLGDPLVPALGWVIIDRGFGVLTFDSLGDAASALAEGLLALVVVNSADGASASPRLVEEIHSLDEEVPVVQVIAPGSSRLAGVDAVIAPPYDADDIASILNDLIERHHQPRPT